MHDPIREGLDRASQGLSHSTKTGITIPKTDDELWEAVRFYFGVEIPRIQICPNHVAPFTAFADAFFARSAVAVWKASRGFGGKSLVLSLLSLSEAVFLGAKVNLLGGSGEQSERVLNYMNGEEMPQAFWGAPNAPRQLIIGGEEAGMLKRMTKLTNGGYMKALMASSKSVRGPHPQRLRLDEVDEMEINIFDSALGQPMKRFGIDDQVVASSTHHYANGTMTEILKRAKDKGWASFEWCYRENLVSNGGWLEDDAVARKKSVVSTFMWDTEYENQEPNPTGRAIDPFKIPVLFDESLGIFEGDEHEYIEIEPPYMGGDPEPFCHRCKHPYDIEDTRTEFCEQCTVPRRVTKRGIYATGTDWAKKKDWTVINTLRLDVFPAKCVAWERTGRLDWPAMVEKHERRVRRYRGGSMHDATGIGNVLEDYLTVASEGVIMVGYARHELISHYIAACEHGKIVYPKIKWAYDGHRLASVEDVYRSGDKYHLPDDIAAGALAWKAGGLGMVGEIYVPGVEPTKKMMNTQEYNEIG